MKFPVSILQELANTHGQSLEKVIEVVENSLTQAYSKTANPVEGAVAKINTTREQVSILAPDGEDVTPEDFGRMAAGTMKQTIKEWSGGLVKRRKLGDWADRQGTLVTGTVRAHAGRNARGETVISLGGGVEAIMPRGEATPGEELKHDQEVVAYIVAVNPDDRGRVKVTVSRRQPELVSALIKEQSPEIKDGRVIITSVAREPGVRAKIAVRGAEGYRGDPVEAVLGGASYRIRAVAAKLYGEKIDVVEDTGNIEEFVANALTPAKVVAVQQNEEVNHPHFLAVVPRDQVSLALGKAGRNVRLASKLTGVKIDVLVED